MAMDGRTDGRTDGWMDEKGAWQSGEVGFRPMDGNIAENLCDDLFGSSMYVDGEQLDVYQRLMVTAHMLDAEVGEGAIIDAIERLENGCCRQGVVSGKLEWMED
jgi:hypothetical protein